MIAVSAAMSLSGAPFDGPVGGVRVGMVDGKLKAFPTTGELENSELDITVAGTKKAIMMVEAGASEVSEETIIEAIELAHKSFQGAIELQNELVKKVGVEEKAYELVLPDEEVQKEVEDFLGNRIRETRGDKDSRRELVATLKSEMVDHLKEKHGDDIDLGLHQEAFEILLKKEVRRAILEEGMRPDNRKPEEIRSLSSEVGILPRVHGSSIFTRGSTQALNVTTLAPLSYAQMIDTMEEKTEKRFFHHYNMPGYSVGEIKRLG